MNFKKIIILMSLIFISCRVFGADTVTITAPADGATVSGQPLSISGTSSRASFRVRLTVNTTEIGYATTDGSGNWIFSTNDLANGSYTIRADLINSSFAVLATDTNSFTVQNAETIFITSPAEDEVVFLNPYTAIGTASLASTTVKLSLDASLVATTTTDTSGNWQAQYSIGSNGIHTLLAELIVSGSPVASSSIDIIGTIPVYFPAGKSQIMLVSGTIPTTGSGSGSGYTYSVSGSAITVTLSPTFSVTPIVLAMGQQTSGSSTVTVSSVSTSVLTIDFTASTESVHFIAFALG